MSTKNTPIRENRPTNDHLESNLRIDPLIVPKIIKDKLDIKSDIMTDNLAPDPDL